MITKFRFSQIYQIISITKLNAREISNMEPNMKITNFAPIEFYTLKNLYLKKLIPMKKISTVSALQ